MTTEQAAALVCPECGKTFKTRSGGRGHYQFAHPELEVAEVFQGPASPEKTGRGKHLLNPPPIEEQVTKEDQFAALAMHLGIPDLTAKHVAWYVCANYDPDDPKQLESALRQRTDLTPAFRMQLWESWTNRVNPGAANDLRKQTYENLVGVPSLDRAKDQGEGLDKRIYGIVGGMVVKDREQALTYHEASALATQQMRMASDQRDHGPAIPWEGIIKAVSERPDSLGQVIDALKQLQPPKNDGDQRLMIELVNTKIEAQGQQFRSTVELIQTSHQAELALLREQNANQMDKLTQALERIAASSARDDSPWDSIDRVLPGTSKRIVEMLTNPPKAEPGVTITLPEGEVSIDAYERLENVKNKRETLKWVREIAPEFIQMGQDFAQAAMRVAKAEEQGTLKSQEQPVRQPALQDGLTMSNCVQCFQKLSYPTNLISFLCPFCGTHQSSDGRILVEPESTPVPQTPQPAMQATPIPAPEAGAPVQTPEPAMEGPAPQPAPADTSTADITESAKEKERVPA